MDEIIQMFLAGIAAGITLGFMVWMVALVVNLFIHIIHKEV